MKSRNRKYPSNVRIMVENGEKLSITNSLTLYPSLPTPYLPHPTWFSNFCFFTEKQIKTTV